MVKKVKKFKYIKDKNIRYKTNKRIKKILLYLVALWTGFVLAISFMEAWLKFQADGVTREIGLSIGSLVFKALNLVELFIGGTVVVLILLPRSYHMLNLYRFLPIILILLLQTFFLLPILDSRAMLIIKGISVAESYDHLYYIVLEVIKVVLLTKVGMQIIKTNEYK
ncbi:hypothetical protein SAMN04489761_1528 [Tenacibaculum sp. MAR_2009_124]|uniref:hypothetical protein n=1 Tax=Tenacibaculum sp. MAR_2009_124 TaxID=1250059 RepID=UPI0008941D57|nr:hypothetical protein [Tenacibaculum sp. MAR_2009_124]SEB71101.1 hypothetical protein SAMN04489761_1528 [Tenacibaculum sp. MAR_2009_124]